MASQRQQILDFRQTAEAVRTRYLAVTARAREAATQIDRELGAVTLALAASYLPSLDEAALRRAAALAGFKGFERRDPLRAREHERHVLETSVTQLRADPRHVDRARLVGDGGELALALAGAEGALAPQQRACDAFESQDGFLRLIELGYDTPSFDVPWYRAEYWKLWSAGDRICRALDLGDFGDDVLPRYREVAAPRDLLRAEVTRLTAEIDAVHDLVRRHDAAVYRRDNLDAIYLADAQGFLAEHLALADLGLLAQWAASEPAVLAALRPVHGARAKRAFVQELLDVGLPPIIQRFTERLAKYDRRLGRIDRGRSLPASDLNDPLTARAPALLAEADKIEKRLDTLVAARNYDGFDLNADWAMWWLHLTRQPPPRTLARTRAWYDQHPEVIIVDPGGRSAGDDAAAAAFMAGRQDVETGGGYLS